MTEPPISVCRAQWSAEEMRIRNQVSVLHFMGSLCGLLPLEDEACPECEGELYMLMHPTEPVVFCNCGFVDPVDPADVDRAMPAALEMLAT